MKAKFKIEKEYEIKHLAVRAKVRHWGDCQVNGVKDEKGDMIPRRSGDNWEPIINVETGIIKDWPNGTTARIHYKVCDEGVYALLDEDGRMITQREGYVPDTMCPGESGYGDYIIMDVGEDGKIDGFEFNDEDWKTSEYEYD